MSKRKSVRFMEDVVPSDKAMLRMSKRRREGNETDDSAYADIGQRLEPRPGEKSNVGDSKHTLDSDEEEDEKYDRLNVANVEGQEDATVDFDEETKITPFNMKEEEEEGHFDSDGTFIFNKKGEQIRDAWLDNIDWGKIKKDAGGLWQGETEEGDEEQSRSPSHIDRVEVFESILKFLQPQETITKALKRLGGSRTMADVRQARWREKKNAMKANVSEENKEKIGQDEEQKASTSGGENTPLPLDENASAVVKLTEWVDSLVNEGVFEIYGYTYEKISHELEKCRKSKEAEAEQQQKQAMASAPFNDDDALDMFADEIDDTKLKESKPAAPPKEVEQKNDDETESSSGVQWEFKWKNEDAAEVFGPYSSQQMQQWTDDDYFKDGVWVRRIGQESAPFYSSKRIDFDLYI